MKQEFHVGEDYTDLTVDAFAIEIYLRRSRRHPVLVVTPRDIHR